MKEIKELLRMYKEDDIDEETLIKELAKLLKASEDEQEDKQEEVEEEKKYSKNVVIGELGSFEGEEAEAIENFISTGAKAPVNIEHTDEVIGEIINIKRDGDKYIAEIYLENPSLIEEYPYLSAEIKILEEEGKTIPVLSGIALTTNPKKNVERVKEKVYSKLSYLPKKIKLYLALSRDKALTKALMKTPTTFNKPEEVIDIKQKLRSELEKLFKGGM